jgi:hypothetical protein
MFHDRTLYTLEDLKPSRNSVDIYLNPFNRVLMIESKIYLQPSTKSDKNG